MTAGVLSVNPNTMYPLLRELEERGLIEGSWEHPERRTRRYYSLTAAGPRGVRPAGRGGRAVPRLGARSVDDDRARGLRVSAPRRARMSGVAASIAGGAVAEALDSTSAGGVAGLRRRLRAPRRLTDGWPEEGAKLVLGVDPGRARAVTERVARARAARAFTGSAFEDAARPGTCRP